MIAPGRGTWLACAAVLACTLQAEAGPRVVLLDIDGVRRDTLETAYRSGKMPNLERLFGRNLESAMWFDNATAAFPAITMAGQASLFTGVSPARHGIPGNQWFDRRTGRVINYFSSAAMPCVYGVAAFSMAECGAGLANSHLQSRTIYEAATAAGKTSTVVFSQYWKGATHVVLPSINEAAALIRGTAIDYQRFDELMVAGAVKSLRRDGIPDLLTLYFTGADGIGHKSGTRGQAEYLKQRWDKLLETILDEFDKLDPTWRTHTQFILTSDHGRTDTKANAADISLEAAIEVALQGSAYVIVENGGVVHLYLRSKQPGAGWTAQPSPTEVEAAAKALSTSPSLKPLLETIAARSNGPGTGYRLIDTDPKEASRITAMVGSIDSARSGDILLLLKAGRYMGNQETTGAQHGSIFQKDLAIPLVIAQGGAAAGHSPVALTTTDIARIIATYLGFTLLPNP